MTRKLLSLFLVLACLLPCMILPLSAAGSTGLKDFSTTTVDADLIGTKYKNKLGAETRIKDAEDINELFPAKSGGEASILEVMEMGYSSTAGSGSSITLYVWVYIPDTTLNVDSEYNMITLADKYDTDPLDEGKTQTADRWTAEEYNRYTIDHVGTSSGGTVHKFAVKGFNAAGCIYSGQRRYNISRLDLHYAGEAEARNYTHGRTYICTGTHTDGTYKAAVDGLDVIQITDLYQTTFRYNNLEDEGEIQRATQINSVYFSIPKEYEEKYDQLFSIRYDCFRYRSTPMIVTVDEDLVNDYINYASGTADMDSAIYGVTDMNSKWGVTTAYYDYSFNATSTDSLKNSAVEMVANSDAQALDWLFWFFPFVGEDQTYGNDDIDDAYVRAEYVLARYQQYVDKGLSTNFLYLVKNGLIQNTVGSDVYGHHADTIFAADTEDEFLGGYEYSSGFSKIWDAFFGSLKDDESIEGVNAIQKIYKSDYLGFIKTADDADICKKYLVDKADVESFKEFCGKQVAMNRTVVVLHFASSIYEVMPAFVFSGENRYCEFNTAYMATQDIFLNFSIIEFTFGDEYEQTVIPVNAPNINISGGITPGGSLTSSVPRDDNGLSIILIILAIIGAILLIWGISVLLKPVTALGNAAARNADNARLRRSLEKDRKSTGNANGSNINIYIDGKKSRTYTDKPKPKKTNTKGRWKK